MTKCSVRGAFGSRRPGTRTRSIKFLDRIPHTPTQSVRQHAAREPSRLQSTRVHEPRPPRARAPLSPPVGTSIANSKPRLGAIQPVAPPARALPIPLAGGAPQRTGGADLQPLLARKLTYVDWVRIPLGWLLKFPYQGKPGAYPLIGSTRYVGLSHRVDADSDSQVTLESTFRGATADSPFYCFYIREDQEDGHATGC